MLPGAAGAATRMHAWPPVTCSSIAFKPRVAWLAGSASFVWQAGARKGPQAACSLAGCVGMHCRYKTQKFNSVASQTSGSLLLLSAISILIPTAAQQLGTGGGPAEAALDALVGAPMALDKVRSADMSRVHVTSVHRRRDTCSLSALLRQLATQPHTAGVLQ